MKNAGLYNFCCFVFHGWKARWKSVPLGIWAFWVMMVSLLSVVLLMMLMVRTPEGMAKGFDFLKSKNHALSGLQSMMVVSTPNDEATEQVSVMAQGHKVVKVLAGEQIPLSMWLQTLHNQRILKENLVVYLFPLDLSPRQKLLFDVQGVEVREWGGAPKMPKVINNLQDPPSLWVGKTSNNSWVVHGSMGVLLRDNQYNGQELTSMDVVRVILWADELERQDAWYRAHPAPEPPANIKPSPVSIRLIPSTVALQETYWLAVGFLALLVGLGSLFVALTEWENARKEGHMEALAGVPRPIWMLVASYVWRWSVNVFVVLVVSGVLATGLAFSLSVPIVWMDLWGALVSVWVLAVVVISIGVMVVSWHASRTWRVWVMVVLLLCGLGFELMYVLFFANPSFLVMLSSPISLIAIVVLGLLCAAFAQWATGIRLERHGRMGLRKF